MITQRVSAERLLVTIALLRVFLNSADTERYANEAIAYYATTVGEEAQLGQKDVSLDYLADFWLDNSSKAWKNCVLIGHLLIPTSVRRNPTGGSTSLRIEGRPSSRR
jgi:hypothetical protein